MAVSVYLSSRVFARTLPQGGLSGPGLSPFGLAVPLAALALSALVSVVVALKERDKILMIWKSSRFERRLQ